MKVIQTLFSIVAVLALLILLFISVEGRMGGESCQCYFLKECQFDENDIGYRYRLCGGSCAAYSGWMPDMNCVNPELIPLPET